MVTYYATVRPSDASRTEERVTLQEAEKSATREEIPVRFVYDPGYVTANVVPVTLCDSPGVRCG
jgi:hypothetical protein